MRAAMVTIRPVVQWPRRVETGANYGVTVDVILDDDLDWPYEDREEFIIGCVLDGGDAFTVEALGSTGVVLHRFGGTYGPVRFLVYANRDPRPDGSDAFRLTLVTEGGVPFLTVSLAVLPLGGSLTEADPIPIEASRWGIRPAEPRPARTHVARPRPAPATRQPQRRTALLIGASASELAGVENDLEAMQDALSHHGFDMRVCSGADATRAGILDAYDQLIADTRLDDAVFVYYTGRGQRVRLPADHVKMDGDLDVGLIGPTDWVPEADEDFRGITTIELDLLHRQLADRTRNVTVAFDTEGMEPTRLLPPHDATTVDRRSASLVAHLGHLRQQQLPIVLPPANDMVVQIRACGRGQTAYEYTNSAGLRHGMFTDVLAKALREVIGLQVTWATLTQHVRRQVLSLSYNQRPESTGPTRRLLFDTVEQRDDSALPVEWQLPDRVRLLGAPLHAVHVGDEFAIMPAGAAGPDDATKLGDAVVDVLRPMAAEAQFRSQQRATTPRIGARAYRTRAVARRLPIEVPNPNAATANLVAALASSTLVRLAEPGEPSEYRVKVDDNGGLTIHDRIGPVTDPVHFPTGTHRVVTDLERLARAAALRAFWDDATSLPAARVHVEWGIVVDGGPRKRSNVGETVHVGEHAYIELRNDSSDTVYASLINIGVAAGVTLLNSHLPSGIGLHPGGRYVLGLDERSGIIHGVPLTWPAGLDATSPRPETILVLTTSEPFDLTVLEQSGVRRSAPPMGRSSLAQYFDQVATGAARTFRGPQDPDVWYSVQAIDFWLDPRARGEVSPQYSSFMTPDELRQLCLGIRPRQLEVDEALLDTIVANVDTYVRLSAETRAPEAPDELRQRLPMLGWLMYEAALDQLVRVQVGFETLAGDAGERSRAAAVQVRRLADAARRLPWLQYAPRALGAIMAHMLVETKRETAVGDEQQRQLVKELRDRYGSLSEIRRGDRLGLDETFLQIALAAVSATVRIAERFVALWREGNTAEEGRPSVQDLAIDLGAAVQWGEDGLSAAAQIEHIRGFADQVDEHRMALPSSYPKLSIATCRALLLLYSLGSSRNKTPDPLPLRFRSAFAYLYRPDDSPPSREYVRSVAGLLLHLALVRPGHELALPFAVGDVVIQRLDDRAVETLSAWLAEIVNGRQRSDGGIVASATMPAFIQTVAARNSGYGAWRLRWFTLDRYASLDGRRERIERIFEPREPARTRPNPDHSEENANAVILIPGFGGSELIDKESGRLVWGMRDVGWYVRAWTNSAILEALKVSDAERDGRSTRIVATRPLRAPAFVPGLRGLEPYLSLVTDMVRAVPHPDAVLEFAYDWRLSVTHNAELLANAADAHLTRWRAHPKGGRNAGLVLIAHSTGGLLAHYFNTVLGGNDITRATVAIGTPFYGTVSSVEILSEARESPVRLPRRLARVLFTTMPGLYDMLPTYRCIDEGDNSRRLSPNDIAALGGDAELASGAFRLHQRLQQGEAGAMHTIIGTGQPTPQSIVYRDGRIDTKDYVCVQDPSGSLQRVSRRGDSVVYRDAATLGDANRIYVTQTNGHLVRSSEVIYAVRAILRSRKPSGPPL